MTKSCLGGLLAVLAQNIKLTYSLNDECELIDVLIKFNVIKENNNKKIIVNIQDMYSEENRNIVFKIKVSKNKDATILIPSNTNLGKFNLEYLDVIYKFIRNYIIYSTFCYN